MGGMPGAGGAPNPGLMASMMGRSPLMTQPGQRPLRQPPGTDPQQPGGEEFYAALAQQDPKAIAEVRRIFKEVRDASLEGRELLERSWWQKLLYINGRQWIYWSPRNGWQDKRFVKWIPRPVTNICSTTIETIRSMLSGIEPGLRVRPNGTAPINVITAQMADDMEPVLYEEHQMQQRFFEADFWAPALGTVYLHPHWDRDDQKHTVFVQALQCPVCGFVAHPSDVEDGTLLACPQDGTPASEFGMAADPSTGEPIGQEEHLGSGRTDVVSELELLYPTYFQRWEDVDRLIRVRWRPKTYYEGRPYADKVRYTNSTAERTLQLYRSLALLTDLSTTAVGQGATAPNRVEGAIEGELWIKPCPQYPRGLWARGTGGLQGETVILYDEERGVMPGPLPYVDQHEKPLWCWCYYPYEEVGGRVHAAGALDKIIQKQDQINRGDSMVELIMQRMANPIWLEPKGAEVQRFTGEPGLIVRYQVVAGTTAKPERIEGINPGQSFFVLREQYFRDAELLSGTSDPLKGSAPAGVEAFSALNLLVERSQSRFTSLFKARGRAYRDWFALAIELERSYGPMERTQSILGQNGSWTFQQFRKQDLQGAISIVIEDGSETPKSSLGKRAAIQHAQTLGVFDPSDPSVAYRTLEILGVPELAPSLDAHTKAAQTEQEQFEQWIQRGRQGPNPMIVNGSQRHQIHIQQHDIWANSDRISMARLHDPQLDADITLHRMQHIMALSNPFNMPLMTAGLIPGMPTPGPGGQPGETGPPQPMPGMEAPPQGGQGAGRAATNSNAESGAMDTLPGAAPGGGNMSAPA
jgi:hypothetical protein